MTTEQLGNGVRVYPAPALAVLRDEYTVRVRPISHDPASFDDADESGWQTVPVYRVRVDMHDPRESSMCYFDFNGRVEVEVVVNGWYEMYRADIRPLSRGVEPHIVGRNRLVFMLDHPANLSVEINRNRVHNLHVFAGALQPEPASEPADVTVHGSPDRPSTLSWYEVNQGIAAVLASGKPRATVRIEPGYHYIADGTWRIPSHTDVVFAGGAVVEGSLVIDHAEDVTVRGRGVLYLNDFKRYAGANGVTIGFSHDVTVEGLVLINPPHYSVFLGSSRNVTIRNLKSFSCEGWSDGVDMMACEDVEIDGCFLRTSDDCIAVYGSRWQYRGGSRGVYAHDCTLWADVAHPMMIGTHGDHEHDGDVLESIRFENIDVLEHNEYQANYLGVMAINAGDKNTVRDVTWRGIRIERITHGRVLDIETKWNKDYNPAPGRLIEHVRIEDVDVTVSDGVLAGDEEPSLIGGYDAGHPVRDIRIVNMRRNGRPCATLEDANITVLGNVGDVTIIG
ncbi:Parallel beta-helix repeat-containing protein [Bifidobacterium ramosum]|uniref:Parallel beta-helix repeat-containing protein n=1 Tax=Bifidobacterium ramosum TaxID=1798158 RepID=A0A6L4WXM2_9BIFI|nr:glycosyl hydrolase family 28 protein [Bifidobacterium ramosum]KAB8286981.1 Parallel beta-helix repeat-containing protein [Bifidobacterium ramosum]NEG72511.1 hypothetical protein [Bifidobacterium ramosum]